MNNTVHIVVPTVGRPSVEIVLRALLEQGVDKDAITVVHDRAGRGPAATRNQGWRATSTEWIAFLDDDVVPDPDWFDKLQADIAACDGTTAATQGRLTVPLPTDRAATDWERNVAALEDALYTTADMAYRRRALEAVGGFDERFPRAYREDADLALRIKEAGFRITRGSRHVAHPVRPAPWHISIGKQAGNADDVLMQRLHGRDWRDRAGAPRGARHRHIAITFSALLAIIAAPFHRKLAAVAAGLWLLATARFAWQRIAPGPKTRSEIASMVVTSAVLPMNATAWWTRARLQQWKEQVHDR